jgi:hypothetical protein
MGQSLTERTNLRRAPRAKVIQSLLASSVDSLAVDRRTHKILCAFSDKCKKGRTKKTVFLSGGNDIVNDYIRDVGWTLFFDLRLIFAI